MSGSLAPQPLSAPPLTSVGNSLLLDPRITFAATREKDGTWSVQFAGVNATELTDWRSLEDFIREMMEP